MACIEQRLEPATPVLYRSRMRANSLPAVVTHPWREAEKFPTKRRTLPAFHCELYDLTINDGAESVGSTSRLPSRQNSKGCIFDYGSAQETPAAVVQFANANRDKQTMQSKLAARRAKLEGGSSDSREDAKTQDTTVPSPVQSPFFSKREARDAEVRYGPFRPWHRPNSRHDLHTDEIEVDAWSLDDWKSPAKTIACQPFLDDKSFLNMRHQVVAAVLAEVQAGLDLAVRDMHSNLRTWISEEVAVARSSLGEASQSMVTRDEEKECSPSLQGERSSWKELAMACNTPDLQRLSSISQEVDVLQKHVCEVDRGKLEHADALMIAGDLIEGDLRATQKTLGRLDEEFRLVRTRMQNHEEQYENVLSDVRELSMQMDCRPTRVDMSSAFAARDGQLNWLESQVQDILLLLNGPPE